MINMIWQPGMTIDAIEREAITQALRYFNNNKTVTANALGIAIRTLDNKLERYKDDDKSIELEQQRRAAIAADFDRRRRGLDSSGRSLIGIDSGAAPKAASQIAQESSGNVRAEAGLLVEPTLAAAPEHQVPLPVGKEIQSVPPKPAAASGARRNR